MFFLFFNSLYCFLPSLLLVLSQNTPSSDHVDPNDPHISDLLVSHYDCSKQHNLRQFSLTRVQPCVQAPSAFETTRAIVNVFVRAKAKRLRAWTCEAYVKRENLSVPNLITNIVVMTVRTITTIPWNVLVLLIQQSVNTLFVI